MKKKYEKKDILKKGYTIERKETEHYVKYWIISKDSNIGCYIINLFFILCVKSEMIIEVIS
ncbi:hypothetical protein H8356DRAFT_1349174 [Neocallimastix lanati (nom. inval.)]|nr:hypothetical protein H8356DRAFT_1349174 [Neocallimastix sp. JGI-2020a]